MSTAETTPAVAAPEPVAATAPVVSEPTTTAPAATETKPEAAAETATAAAPTEEKVGKDEVKIVAAPVSEGTLTYKSGGLLKSLLSSKKHFWLGSEPVSHESLSKYLKEEKDDKHAHHNVAHASQTGEGLLFYTKRAEDKSTPEGIINLADATEMTREPADRFSFKVHGKKHEFFAPSRVEVDGWIVAIEAAIEKAIANKDTVVDGENYKATHSKLGGAAVAGATGAAAGAATGAATTKDAVHDGPAATETTAVADKKDARSSSKGRSQSRKRASIFGGLMGKKDEKSVERANEKEAKKEVKEEEKHEKAAEKEAKKEEKAEEKAVKAEQDAKFHENRKAEEVAAAVLAAPTIGEETKATEPASTGLPTAITEGTAPVIADTASPTTKQNKRASIFGFLGKKSGDVPTTKDASKETTPAVPAKDTPVTNSTAPQLDPVDTSIPAETAVASETPAAAATTTEASAAEPHHNPLSAVENTPEAKAANKQKEGGDLFSFMKKKKAEVDEKKAIDSTEGVAAAEKTEGTATSPNTDKRRSSFFNTLGGKKERGVSPEGEKKSGLGGLFRKSSKSVKPITEPVTDSSVPPAIPANAESAAATEPIAASTEAAPASETVTKAELPAVTGATTGTDSLPTTTAATEATPAATTTTTTV